MDKRISQRKETTKRRKSLSCKVFEIKVDKSHLSTKTSNHLKQIFVEAKWFYNYCLSLKDINIANTTAKNVPVKVADTFEERYFTALKSQMKQAIKTRIFNSLSALSALKKKGYKVGRLKFKSRIESVPLKQYKVTFDFDREHSRIRIQGIKPWIKVRGLEQIPTQAEIANANLIYRCGDFYIHVTTFSEKESRIIPEQAIGIDFGCQTQLTLSNGTKIEYQVSESQRLKRLSRRIDKKVNGKVGKNRQSRNRRKLQEQRRKEYDRLTNKKKDIHNKVVNAITKSYKYVCFQDESIHAWHAGNHGKKIQHSAIGGIIRDLKHKSHTPVMVDKFFPSTQLCPHCGCLNKLKLSDRVYMCDCGYSEDRDIKSAKCIENEGLTMLKSCGSIPVDHRDLKLEESVSSTCFDLLTNINGIKVSKICSMSQEAPLL